MRPTCFHCGEPIPDGTALDAYVDGAVRAVCCIGCHAAVQWIATLGLQDYYRLRDTPAERAAARPDFTAWDRAQLQRLYVRTRDDGAAEVCVLVQGLRCAACSWLIERALRDVAGVREVLVNPAARRVQLVWDPRRTALSALLDRLACLGYTPRPLDAASLDAVARDEQRDALKRLMVAALGMMQAMMYAVALYAGAFEGMDALTRDFFRWLGLLVCAPVVLYAGAGFFAGAVREWRARQLGMDTPVAFAIALVFAASLVETVRGGAQVYFDSAGMFVFLLLAARYVEMHGRQRAAEVVDALARLQPATAQRRRGDDVETVGTHELEPDDVVLVATGEAIPADGVQLSTTADVDEALLTGEATPCRKRRGDTLIAGSLLRSAPIELCVRRIGADTVLSAMLRMVTRAQQQRPRWVRLGDAAATRFVAGVLLLTVLTAATWCWFDPSRAFGAALAVLVVSCPCAFALSVPAATTRAVALLARRGVLVLKADALEKLLALTRIVFDKTGTLTTASLELGGIETLGARSREDCLRIAAALERGSTHPIAAALRRAAGDVATAVSDRQAVPGAGVGGVIDGVAYRLGQASFACPGADADDGVVLAGDAGALAHFELRETLRPEAAATLAALRAQGLGVEILSGDSVNRVAAVARRLALDTFRARATPLQKLARVQALRSSGETIGMVGDGINDAPVLAGADVAIAFADGAQLAQANADIVLAGGRLDALPDALATARLTMRVLRQNMRWSLVYNFLSIPLAAAGLVPPWLAALGMSASSLLVVLNSLRIRLPQRAAATHTPHVQLEREAAPA